VVAPPRSRVQRALEAAALALAGIAIAALLGRALRRVDGIHAALLLGLALTAGYLAADLVSGLVHWFGDRFFEEDTPIIGRVFIVPFREHHRDPLVMTRHDALELLGTARAGRSPSSRSCGGRLTRSSRKG
jgi:Lipid desaturase domain